MRRKEQRSMLMLAIIMAFVVGVFWAGPVGAGDGNPCAALQMAADRLGCELGCGAPAPVEKTGQTDYYEAGDDGDLQKGVAWPEPRFTDNEDGTVTDELTGLIWAENASAGLMLWSAALTHCNDLTLGEHTDWRLPNIKELQSLIDYGNYRPCLPSGHPFSGVESDHYWSSTTIACPTDSAWYVYLDYGDVFTSHKANHYYVWPVRGGE